MAPESPPTAGGSIWTRQVGPMPFWAWGAIGIALAVIYRVWRNNAAAAAGAGQQTMSTPDTTPPQVFQAYTTILNPIETAPEEPPGQGRVEPPQGDHDHGDHHVPHPPKKDKDRDTPKPKPEPRPAPKPAPKPAPPPKPAPAPSGRWVTVAKWNATKAPWNSTVWGIATHYGIKSWQTVWNAPQNASLRSRRKKPELIQPGDKVWVPA